ncbi:hypothetical protein [Nocardia cerradoensis]|uniref:Uncharacterized protein n=1 Tax=Nocardia cerradoensis TaxID=85688 RepID=A0A231GX48_9NOCA|nr:hypothetical protein [Nocardia cerradoensis]OXR41186.1 hypothetical protein B7C42_06782 [Nocardia cerradoensis]
MTDPGGVTVADTVRWLHGEGLVRLAGLAERTPDLLAAYTIDVATGTVNAYPVTGAGAGSAAMTFAADDLPDPVGTARRLVVVGVTSSQAVLVVDLAASLAISITSARPEPAARSWVLQLLLNPEVTITTNSAELTPASDPRCRTSFIPGSSATIVNVDDMQPPLTTITLNPATDGPDHLDVGPDGTGEMYLGTRFWQLHQVMTVGDEAWSAISARLSGTADDAVASGQPPGPAVSAPPGRVSAPGVVTGP